MAKRNISLVLLTLVVCVNITGCKEKKFVKSYSSEIIYTNAPAKEIEMALNIAWHRIGCDQKTTARGWTVGEGSEKKLVASRTFMKGEDKDGNEITSQRIICTGRPTLILIDCDNSTLRHNFVNTLLAELAKER